MRVKLDERCLLIGVVMVDLIKSVGCKSTKAKFIEIEPHAVINKVYTILDTF